MTLSAIKTSTGHLVEGEDAAGKPVEVFFNSYESANYDQLVEAADHFVKNERFQAERAKLPDPERDLYLSIFGKGNEHADTALHTTLVEPQEARDGIAIDWSQDPVTAVLRLVYTGHGDRLRLINGSLVDMGPTQPSSGSSSAGVGSVGPVGSDAGSELGEGPGPDDGNGSFIG